MRLLTADESYDDDGPYDPAEHSPMYDVDMEDRTAVFDLAMEDDSDDGGGLLDWSILAGRQRCAVSMPCGRSSTGIFSAHLLGERDPGLLCTSRPLEIMPASSTSLWVLSVPPPVALACQAAV